MKTIHAIETRELSKKFGSLTAVDRLTVDINHGEIFGLLGPNGAGKTTSISMLCTIINPTSGIGLVNGFDIVRQSGDVRRSIGIVFQDPSVDSRLTGRENLRLHAGCYDIPSRTASERIAEVLHLVGLEDRADTIMKNYSGGMRRRLELARGLLHHPKILFLDEPTLGLDPQTREHIWTYIEDLAKKIEITIILTTHYMEEAEKLCNRVAIIDYGKIKVCDSPDNLKRSLNGDVLAVKTTDPNGLCRLLPAMGVSCEGDISRDMVRLHVPDADRLIPRLIETANTNGIAVSSVSVHHPTLNDVFLHHTGHEIRPEGAESFARTFMRGHS